MPQCFSSNLHLTTFALCKKKKMDTMSEILVATEKPFASEAITKIKKVTDGSKHTLKLLEKYALKEELKNAVRQTEALIVRSDIIDKEIIDAGERLKIIVRAGAGFDNIDTGYAATKNIVVMNILVRMPMPWRNTLSVCCCFRHAITSTEVPALN